MGPRFRSLFKKKKNQEPAPPPLRYENSSPPLLHTQLYSSTNDALTFTHGSLLDDVLNGLKDHQNTKKDSPELPSSITRHLDSWTKTETGQLEEQEQKGEDPRDYHQQTISGSSGNNRASIYHQSMVTQTSSAPCRPTPESTFVSPAPPSTPCPPTLMRVTAETPGPSVSASPPRSLTSPLVTLAPPAGPETPSPALGQNDSDISDGPSLNSDMDLQHQKHRSAPIHQRPPLIKSPSIISSKPSLESNHDKRNRHSLVTPGVSMSRMKERHRQECRRSLQSNPIPSLQQSDPLYQAPISASPSFLSFQQSPLVQQQQQQQPQKLNQMAQRPYQVPSMEPLPHTMTPSTSFSYAPPPPNNNIVRSSSMMTDMYLPPTPPFDWNQHHTWRQQPLFPFQSDFVLPPYNPAQLTAIQSQSMMMYPPLVTSSSSSYRMNNSNLENGVPRSVSVYGGAKHINPGPLVRSPTTDISTIQQRKSMPIGPREYQPQLLVQMPEQHQSKRPNRQSAAPSIVDSPTISNDPPTTQSSGASSTSSRNQSTNKTDVNEDTPSTVNSPSDLPAAQSSPVTSSTSSRNQPNKTDVVDEEDMAHSDFSSCTINHGSDSNQSLISPAASVKTSTPSGLDEKLEIPVPSRVEQPPKSRTHTRRFSLPTLPISSWNKDANQPPTETAQDSQPVNSSNTPPQSATPDKLQIPSSNHPHGWPGEAHSCSNTTSHSCNNWSSCAIPSPPPTTCYGHHHHQHFMHHGCQAVPPPCCTPSPCYARPHHHHNRSTHKQCHHHHQRRRHHPSKPQMSKSVSMMIKPDDDDDAKTIGSTTKSLLEPQFAKEKTPIKEKPMANKSRRTSLRAFLPPRFSTALPKDAKRLSASNWIRS